MEVPQFKIGDTIYIRDNQFGNYRAYSVSTKNLMKKSITIDSIIFIQFKLRLLSPMTLFSRNKSKSKRPSDGAMEETSSMKMMLIWKLELESDAAHALINQSKPSKLKLDFNTPVLLQNVIF